MLDPPTAVISSKSPASGTVMRVLSGSSHMESTVIVVVILVRLAGARDSSAFFEKITSPELRL